MQSPMTIAFAACIGDRQDVALVLMTPATISVCRADQRADAAARLGYSKQVFDRVNDRNGGQKYKTVFNPPSRSRGNGRRRRTAAAPAAAGAPPATGAAAAGPWPPHAVDAAVQAPAIVATYGTPHYAPAGTGVWQPDLPQSAPVQHEGEVHAAGRGGSLGADSPAEHGPFFPGSGAARRGHSLDPILAQAVEDLQMGNLPTPLHVAGNASVFEDASEPWFSGWVPHEGHADPFADQMDWDEFMTGNPRLADDEGIGEGHGGHAASAPVSWSDLSSFCADPPLVVAPQATPAATQMPAPSAVDLARGAETPCTSADAAGGAAAGQAFGQQGVPHYLRPECQPVPTAVALRGRNLQQVPQPAARPQLTPGGAAPEGDLQMAADERLEPDAEALKCFHAWLDHEIWMDLPGAPEHSAFGAAEDVLGFQQYQRQSLHEGTAADLPFGAAPHSVLTSRVASFNPPAPGLRPSIAPADCLFLCPSRSMLQLRCNVGLLRLYLHRRGEGAYSRAVPAVQWRIGTGTTTLRRGRCARSTTPRCRSAIRPQPAMCSRGGATATSGQHRCNAHASGARAGRRHLRGGGGRAARGCLALRSAHSRARCWTCRACWSRGRRPWGHAACGRISGRRHSIWQRALTTCSSHQADLRLGLRREMMWRRGRRGRGWTCRRRRTTGGTPVLRLSALAMCRRQACLRACSRRKALATSRISCSCAAGTPQLPAHTLRSRLRYLRKATPPWRPPPRSTPRFQCRRTTSSNNCLHSSSLRLKIRLTGAMTCWATGSWT